MKKLKISFWLMPLLLLALFLRTYGLSGRGLIDGDEVAYYSVTGGTAAHLRWWAGETIGGSESSGRRETLTDRLHRLHLRPNYPLGYGVAYSLLAILILSLAGPTLFHFLLINATLGAATVACVFWLTRRLESNPAVAWMASFALALSGFHLIWSRSGFPHLGASFFLVLGYACYAQGVWGGRQRARGWLLGAGLALGIAFGFHPTTLPFLGACFLTELYRSFRGVPLRRVIENLILLAGGILLTFGLLEGLSRALHHGFLADFSGIYGEGSPSYLRKVFVIAERNVAGANDPAGSKISTYLRMPFLYGEGALYSLLAALGFGALIRRFWKKLRVEDFFVVAAVAIPLLIFFVAPIRNFPRNVVGLTPLVALLAGQGLFIVHPRGTLLRWAIPLLFVSVQVSHFGYLFNLRSSYAQAEEWLARRGNVRVLDPSKNQGNLYTHGIGIFHVIQAKGENRLAVTEWPAGWRKSFNAADSPFYTSVIGTDGGGKMSKAVSLLGSPMEEAKFRNPHPFTAKKIEMLKTVRRLARIVGSDKAAAWADRQLKREERIVDAGSLRLLRIR